MKRIVLCLILSFFVSASAYASSVDTFGIGPRATALGGAVGANSDDVYSIYYNPASMVNMSGREVSVAIQMCDPRLKLHNYTVSGGESAATGAALEDIGSMDIEDASDNLFIPFIGYAQQINSRLALGAALYVPFGLDIEWSKNPETNISAYNTYHSYYIREAFTPTLSYKVNDKFSVGVGVALGKSRSGAEKILKLGAPSEVLGTPATYDTYNAAFASTLGNYASTYAALAHAYAYDGSELKIEMDDSFNYSVNVGFLYSPSEIVSLGLTIRSQADADFDGDVSINGVKVTTAEMAYDHPEQIQASVMVRPIQNVSVELDVVWTDWSINGDQTTRFTQALLGIESERMERDWHDTNQIRIGAEWQVSDTLALRCGYFYDPSPVPDDTFDIMWPDADRKTYSIGAGLDLGKWTVDTSFQLAYAETKRIIGGESENLNDSYNPTGIEGYTVQTSADGYLLGYGLSLTYHF